MKHATVAIPPRLSALALTSYSIWLFAGSLCILFPEALGIWCLFSLPAIALLLADRKLFADAIEITAKLQLDAPAQLWKTVRFTIQVQSCLEVRGRLSVFPISSKLVDFSPRMLPCTFTLAPNGAYSAFVELQGSVVHLGYESLSSVELESDSLLGLWKRCLVVPTQTVSYRVTPAIEEISTQDLRRLVSGQPLLSQSSRRLVRSRSRDQFHSVRRYQFPDPVTDVDHRKSARFQQLMVRSYDSVEQHQLVLLYDIGRALVGEIRGSAKADYYLSAIIALTRYALTQGDTVSLAAFSQRPHITIRKVRSLVPFDPVLRGDRVLAPREEESNYQLLPNLVNQLTSQRSIVVILSDLSRPATQSPLLQVLPFIARRHLTLCLGLIDQEYDLTTRLIELGSDFYENEEQMTEELFWKLFYSYQLDQQFRVFRASANRLGGGAVQIPEQHWISSVAKTYGLLRTSLYS